MLSFIIYLLYSQLHCAVKSLQAVILGQATTLAVTKPLTDALQVKFLLSPNSEPLARGRVMYLCNHRSWADFMVDSVLTNGGSYLARYGVFFGVPMSCLYGWISGSVFFFHRRRGIDRNWLSNFLEKNWSYRPTTGLIVYPEGTRNLKKESLPLKRGCLEAAYKLQVPIQVIITTNKEEILNERKLSIKLGTPMVVTYSIVIHPKDYESLQDWYNAIQQLWDETWSSAHSCNDGAPFTGKNLEVITKASAERAVMHRVWTLRAVLLLSIAALAIRLLRRDR